MRVQEVLTAGNTPDFPVVPAAAAEVSLGAAKDVLARLARAVQRATIYPDRHPATRVATTPLVEAVSALLRDVPQFVIGVTSGRLFVGTRPDAAQPLESPWLASRMAALDIAALTFAGALSLENAETVVTWLARAGSHSSNADLAPPAVAGCEITKLDFAAARFKDTGDHPPQLEPEAAAWRAICAALLQEWDGTVESAENPADLAQRVLAAVERHEGAGVGDLGERLGVLAAHLSRVDPEVGAVARARLGEFVEALSPELRRQLLVASPKEDPGKLALMSDLLDRLPNLVVLEMIEELEFVRGASSHQFLSLVLKLTRLSSDSPAVRDAVVQKCLAAGLPDPGELETTEARHTLEALLTSRAGDVSDVNPDEYQRRLEHLSATAPLAREYVVDTSRHIDPRASEDVTTTVDHIALLLLRAGSPDPRDAACFDRLREALPRHLESGDYQELADVSVQLVALSLDRVPDVVAHARECQRFFTEPSTVAAVLQAVLASQDGTSFALSMLARAGDSRFADDLFATLAATTDPQVARRLAGVLPSLDLEVVRASLTAAYRRDPSVAPALLFALHHLTGLPLAAEMAFGFLGDRDPIVRIEACRLLFSAHLSPARLDAVVRRALDDSEPKVVDDVLDQLERRGQPMAVAALARFVDEASPERFERQQVRAARLMGAHGTPEALGALATAMAGRYHRMDATARRVSSAMAEVLLRLDDPNGHRAARTWRRSPAGLLSRFTHYGGQR